MICDRIWLFILKVVLFLSQHNEFMDITPISLQIMKIFLLSCLWDVSKLKFLLNIHCDGITVWYQKFNYLLLLISWAIFNVHVYSPYLIVCKFNFSCCRLANSFRITHMHGIYAYWNSFKQWVNEVLPIFCHSKFNLISCFRLKSLKLQLSCIWRLIDMFIHQECIYLHFSYSM